MARTKNSSNGWPDKLQEAMSALTLAQPNLVQAHAALTQQHKAFLAKWAEIAARMAENDARMAETNRINSERFARIEAILLEHSRILRALPDVIRDKIGFKSPPQQATE